MKIRGWFLLLFSLVLASSVFSESPQCGFSRDCPKGSPIYRHFNSGECYININGELKDVHPSCCLTMDGAILGTGGPDDALVAILEACGTGPGTSGNDENSGSGEACDPIWKLCDYGLCEPNGLSYLDAECHDINGCNTDVGKKEPSIECEYSVPDEECEPVWIECGYGDCQVDNRRYFEGNCHDANSCNTELNKPARYIECEYVPPVGQCTENNCLPNICPEDQCDPSHPGRLLVYPRDLQASCQNDYCIKEPCAPSYEDSSPDCLSSEDDANKAKEEICDGNDNNNDGEIDEGLEPPLCSKQLGVCSGAKKTCKGSGGWQDCISYGEAFVADETSLNCDNLDNDCDGTTDEGCGCQNGETKACGTDAGICQSGTQACNNGIWDICRNSIGQDVEICNGLDDDCDGQTDEDDSNRGDFTLRTGCNINSCQGTRICSSGNNAACNIFYDDDRDNLCAQLDNCPEVNNPLQQDTDRDGIGNSCDICPNDRNNDIDGDGVCGDIDNCISSSNSNQLDGDNDGMGDRCDTCPSDEGNDFDNDELCADLDNCQLRFNPDQRDCDNDDIGDACDPASNCISDSDSDGIKDNLDNCVSDSNTDQKDSDGDFIGDECDSCNLDFQNDEDRDLVCGNIDNCPRNTNANQQDTDADGMGDACDRCQSDPLNDIDADNLCRNLDNCPASNNPSQLDCDNDGVGDACDQGSLCSADSDRDSIMDLQDNCVDYYNPYQEDFDRDNIGDACDSCIKDGFNDLDQDGICGEIDNCVSALNFGQEDNDNDGIGNICDICQEDDQNDIDKDMVCAELDNCRNKFNPTQSDCDGNGIGDSCDIVSSCAPDIDIDEIPVFEDNCETSMNPGQLDKDGDGIGDGCDYCRNDAFNDIDGDGICGDVDNCPTISNQNQFDFDRDHKGDICDRCRFDPENDIDEDLVCGDADNCKFKLNPSQKDCDLNFIGDACDFNSLCTEDTDKDGFSDIKDDCPEIYDPMQEDSDKDSIGDKCDACPIDLHNDIDQDAVCSNNDNCPLIFNPTQSNIDKDGAGDACDLCQNDRNNDIDADSICGDIDNCPTKRNPYQENCDDIDNEDEIFDKRLKVQAQNEIRSLIDASFIANMSKDDLKNSEDLKKLLLIETKEYLKDGKTFTKCRITINTKKPISNFVYLQNIPKCLAEKADKIYFNGKNYNILDNDPIIAWHFADVKDKIELSYEVEGVISDKCMADIKDFVYSSSQIKSITDPKIYLPFLLIPIIGLVFLYLQKINKNKKEIEKDR